MQKVAVIFVALVSVIATPPHAMDQASTMTIRRVEVPADPECAYGGGYSNQWDDRGLLLSPTLMCDSPGFFRLDRKALFLERIAIEPLPKSPEGRPFFFDMNWNWRVGSRERSGLLTFIVQEEQGEQEETRETDDLWPTSNYILNGRFKSATQLEFGKPFGKSGGKARNVQAAPLDGDQVVVLRHIYDNSPSLLRELLLFKDGKLSATLDSGNISLFDINPERKCVYYAKDRSILCYNASLGAIQKVGTLDVPLSEEELNNVVYLQGKNSLLINDSRILEGGGALWIFRLDQRDLSRVDGRFLFRGKVGRDRALYEDLDTKKGLVMDGGRGPVVEFEGDPHWRVVSCRITDQALNGEIILVRSDKGE